MESEQEHFNNGRLCREVPYNQKGQLHGVVKSWYIDGQIRSEVPYHKGQLHGTTKYWYGNGQIRLEVPYRHDQRYGVTRVWDEHGKLTYKTYHLCNCEVTEEKYHETYGQLDLFTV